MPRTNATPNRSSGPPIPRPSSPLPKRVPNVRLDPSFEIEDHTVVMATQLIVGMSLRNLGQVVISLHDRRHAIVGAIGMLIVGA
jgi:hypothetical protein